MNVSELLDTIEDALSEGTAVPLSGGKRIVDVEQIREYLNEVRANLPGELRQSKAIVNDRQQIVEDANGQASAIIKKAEERAQMLISEAEVVKGAQKRAAEILAAADKERSAIRQGVTDYCDDVLRQTEEAVGTACLGMKEALRQAEESLAARASEIKSVRATLRQMPKKEAKPQE